MDISAFNIGGGILGGPRALPGLQLGWVWGQSAVELKVLPGGFRNEKIRKAVSRCCFPPCTQGAMILLSRPALVFATDILLLLCLTPAFPCRERVFALQEYWGLEYCFVNSVSLSVRVLGSGALLSEVKDREKTSQERRQPPTQLFYVVLCDL